MDYILGFCLVAEKIVDIRGKSEEIDFIFGIKNASYNFYSVWSEFLALNLFLLCWFLFGC